MMRTRLYLLHPYLFAVFPILFLGAYNLDHIGSITVFLKLVAIFSIISLSATAVLLFTINLFIKNKHKSALIGSLFLVLFFTYGRIFELIWEYGVLTRMRSLHIVLLTFTIIVISSGSYVIARAKRNLRPIHTFLAAFSFFMILSSAYTVASNSSIIDRVRNKLSHTQSISGDLNNEIVLPGRPNNVGNTTFNKREELPDVYYIVLDGYLRADKLQQFFNFSNSNFITYLEKKGFYVAEKSHSNYSMTFLSLASSLNFTYLDDIVHELKKINGSDTKNRKPFHDMIQTHLSGYVLKSFGYHYITALTNWGPTGKVSPLADTTYSYSPLFRLYDSEMTGVLLRTTMLRELAPGFAKWYLFNLEKIKDIPNIDEPTYAFIHSILPHPPAVFDKDGTELEDVVLALQQDPRQKRLKTDSDWGNKKAYTDQISFLNKKMEEIIDHIIANSAQRPIIIIQADHGSASSSYHDIADEQITGFPEPRMEERFSILNAYYVPESVKTHLYPNISPVNTFRLIFSEYFGLKYDLLPDNNYFSWYDNTYEFRDVTHLLNNPE